MQNFTRGNDGREASTAGLAAIPTSNTAIVATGPCKLMSLYVTNNTAGTITLAIKNGDFSTTYFTKSVPANDATLYDFDSGMILPAGLAWIAGGAGLHGDVCVFRRN